MDDIIQFHIIYLQFLQLPTVKSNWPAENEETPIKTHYCTSFQKFLNKCKRPIAIILA